MCIYTCVCILWCVGGADKYGNGGGGCKSARHGSSCIHPPHPCPARPSLALSHNLMSRLDSPPPRRLLPHGPPAAADQRELALGLEEGVALGLVLAVQLFVWFVCLGVGVRVWRGRASVWRRDMHK